MPELSPSTPRHGVGGPELRVREFVAEGIENVRAWLDEKTIADEALDGR